MLVGEFKAKNIAGQIESADLAAAVAEDFVGADAAADDLVKIVGRFVLAENFGIARIGHHGAHQMHRLIERIGVERTIGSGVETVTAWRAEIGGAADCVSCELRSACAWAFTSRSVGRYC